VTYEEKELVMAATSYCGNANTLRVEKKDGERQYCRSVRFVAVVRVSSGLGT
jgi:hypothetical protein